MIKRLHNVLWTGGLDSTYRILELSRENVQIQPYYIIDYTRGSIKQELNAIKKIESLVKKHPDTKAELLPLKTFDLRNIEDDAQITASWKLFADKYKLGTQYDYIARYAKQEGLRLELGIEASPRGKVYNLLSFECQLIDNQIFEQEGVENTLMVDPNRASKECIDVFGNIDFPKRLYSLSKVEEVEEMKAWGHKETMLTTWFCHRPIFGLSCGRCNPCKDAKNEGMSWRLSKIGCLLGLCRGVHG